MKGSRFRSSFYIFLSAVTLFHSPLSVANTPPVIGLVVWVTGTMKAAMPNAAPRALTRRSPVYEADTIITDQGGSGQIVFTDNSIVSLRNDTTLQIAKFRYTKGAPAGSNSEALNLIKGGFRTITGAITKENPQAYKATTPVATIGVAGTVYSAYFDRASKDLFTKLDKGIVYVTNAQGTITLSKSPATGAQSNCAINMYSEVKQGSQPVIVCDLPDVFISEPPLIPVGFPSKDASGAVGSFCVSENTEFYMPNMSSKVRG